MKKILVMLLASTLTGYSTTYTGSLTVISGGLTATEPWSDVELYWVVTDVGYSGNWNYDYRILISKKAISHVIIETSPSFLLENILDVACPSDYESIEVSDFDGSSQGKSNPGIPGEIYGIKFDLEGDTLGLNINFTTDRAPVWGDIYAKSGKHEGNFVYMYNEGFARLDPLQVASSGSVDNHVLVPDTIPETSSVLLGCIGTLMLLRRRR